MNLLRGELKCKIIKSLEGITASSTLNDQIIDTMIKEIVCALVSADVSLKLALQFKKSVENKLSNIIDKKHHIKQIIFDEFCKLLNPGVETHKFMKGQPNVILFTGIHGSGVTTTCRKFSKYHEKLGWKVGLVDTNTFRSGIISNMQTKSNIPFYGSYLETDPIKVAKDGIELFKKEGFELILIDTCGKHQNIEFLFEDLDEFIREIHLDHVILVIDSFSGQSSDEQATEFKSKCDGSCIITKLDGHAKGLGALSTVSVTRLPIMFVANILRIWKHVSKFLME